MTTTSVSSTGRCPAECQGKFKPQEMEISHGTNHRFHIVNKGMTQPRPHCYVNELNIDYMTPNQKKQQRQIQILHFVDWPKTKIPNIGKYMTHVYCSKNYNFCIYHTFRLSC